jgi:D-tyrosyl-tRNA(Tyr) deacylase
VKVFLQRVKKARVEVDGRTVGAIGAGLVLLVGFREGDTENQLEPMAQKVAGLRIFEDDEGKMNLSLLDRKDEVLIISQFTLYGDTTKGRRPSFTNALNPRSAERFYLQFCRLFENMGLTVATGVFGARMLVEIHNWGPVTFVLEG